MLNDQYLPRIDLDRRGFLRRALALGATVLSLPEAHRVLSQLGMDPKSAQELTGAELHAELHKRGATPEIQAALGVPGHGQSKRPGDSGGHDDIPHLDAIHNDYPGNYQNHADHQDHGDLYHHQDYLHGDSPHADSDKPNRKDPPGHTDMPHEDHDDGPKHADVVHLDGAPHSDHGHADSPHLDVPHEDHNDATHVDSLPPHFDDPGHQDGFVGHSDGHCDLAHTDHGDHMDHPRPPEL